MNWRRRCWIVLKKFGPLAQCRAVNYWRNLSSNMLSRMMCDALHETDTGDGVIF
jgi:PTS system ascorbate-specific IIA component